MEKHSEEAVLGGFTQDLVDATEQEAI